MLRTPAVSLSFRLRLRLLKKTMRYNCRQLSPSQVVLESLYPGSPFERQILGLEVADLVISELVCGGSRKKETEEACVEPLEMVRWYQDRLFW